MRATNRLAFFSLSIVLAFGGIACFKGSGMNTSDQQNKVQMEEQQSATAPELQTATFGNGCFWCTEAVFAELEGVQSVTSGYSGGEVDNPTYQQVCTGTTGHAEVVQIKFDPKVIAFEDLLQVFWKTHDPTTLNQQSPDSGTQYRSAVFYHSEEQQKLAEKYKAKLDDAKAFNAPIVTEITKFEKFYPAETDHQNFYKFNGNHPYCRANIPPKLEKLRAVFGDKLKKK